MKILLINKYHFFSKAVERAFLICRFAFQVWRHEVAFFPCRDPKTSLTPWGAIFRGVELIMLHPDFRRREAAYGDAYHLESRG